MKETTKSRMVNFGMLLAAAILGAAIWEFAGNFIQPANAQRDYPDPRNVTAMRMEQLKATAEVNQSVKEITKYLQSGELKVKAEVENMVEVKEETSAKTKKTSKKRRKTSNGNTEIEIIKD